MDCKVPYYSVFQQPSVIGVSTGFSIPEADNSSTDKHLSLNVDVTGITSLLSASSAFKSEFWPYVHIGPDFCCILDLPQFAS